MGELKRALGTTALTFYGVGVIVGAGIYSVIGAAAAEAGYGLWLSFLIAALVAGMTALSYAELASALPTTGAEYVFLRRAFPKIKWAGYIAGVIILLNGAATAATVALAFAGYFSLIVPVAPLIVAAVLLVMMSAVNIAGIRESSWINIVLTSIEVGGLLLIIGAGISTSHFAEKALQPLNLDTLRGAALIFFVYTGFEGLVNLTEEAKQPRKAIPKALIISLLITTVIYVLVALASLSLVTPEILSGSESPLSTAVETVSPEFATAIAWVALFATSNTALITLIVTSRLLFSMARGKDLPSLLATTNKRQSPWIAALVMLVLSLAIVPFGKVEVAAKLAAFASLSAFVAVNVALIRLRFTEPELKRAFRIPLAVGRMPIIPIIAILTCGVLLSQFDSTTYLVGGVTIALGAAIYVSRRFWRRESGK